MDSLESGSSGKKREFTPPDKAFENDLKRFGTPGTSERENLLRYATSLYHNTDEAESAVQETVLRAWQNHHAYQMGTNMAAWLTTIVKNNFMQSHRSRNRVTKYAKEYRNRAIGERTLSDDPFRALLVSEKHRNFEHLPEEVKGAVIAVNDTGTFEEAAKRLGISAARVERLLESAVSALEHEEGRPEARNARERARDADAELSAEDLEKYLPLLPAKHRDIYRSVVIENKTYPMAAAELGVPEGTIKSNLGRARQRLAELKRSDQSSSGETPA
ncbi:MAG: hypothetical protein HYS26_03345 [Candidatus Kaiserbacteria bacterium]|nr:MAG: hypothetical protein HYS26_03345 [Candidatus Kaiserbacteria bacterium]